MKILGISQPAPCNFGSRIRIPMKNGTTTVLNIVNKPHSGKITQISGDIMHKGKSLEKILYKNKKGFSDERFAEIIETLCKDAINPEEASYKITMNQLMHTIDYNV